MLSAPPFHHAPPRAYEPKVLVPYKTTPDQVPRKIQIERLRRVNLSESVVNVLEAAGIPIEALVTEILPLHYVDDIRLDPRSPVEWLTIASREDGHTAYLPARAIRIRPDAPPSFEHCCVVRWRVSDNHVGVVWGVGTAATPLLASAVTEEDVEYVPRIRVQLLAEHPVDFVDRIKAAIAARAAALSCIRVATLAHAATPPTTPPLTSLFPLAQRALALLSIRAAAANARPATPGVALAPPTAAAPAPVRATVRGMRSPVAAGRGVAAATTAASALTAAAPAAPAPITAGSAPAGRQARDAAMVPFFCGVNDSDPTGETAVDTEALHRITVVPPAHAVDAVVRSVADTADGVIKNVVAHLALETVARDNRDIRGVLRLVGSRAIVPGGVICAIPTIGGAALDAVADGAQDADTATAAAAARLSGVSVAAIAVATTSDDAAARQALTPARLTSTFTSDDVETAAATWFVPPAPILAASALADGLADISGGLAAAAGSVAPTQPANGTVATPLSLSTVARRGGDGGAGGSGVVDAAATARAQQKDRMKEARAAFAFGSFRALPHVATADVTLRRLMEAALHTPLLAMDTPSGLPLGGFVAHQTARVDTVVSWLKNEWKTAVVSCISSSLAGVGKGWLNVSEIRREIYDISKLKRLMLFIRIRMESTLRELVRRSLLAFTRLIEGQCGAVVHVESLSEVRVARRRLRPRLVRLQAVDAFGSILSTDAPPAIPPPHHAVTASASGAAMASGVHAPMSPSSASGADAAIAASSASSLAFTGRGVGVAGAVTAARLPPAALGGETAAAAVAAGATIPAAPGADGTCTAAPRGGARRTTRPPHHHAIRGALEARIAELRAPPPAARGKTSAAAAAALQEGRSVFASAVRLNELRIDAAGQRGAYVTAWGSGATEDHSSEDEDNIDAPVSVTVPPVGGAGQPTSVPCGFAAGPFLSALVAVTVGAKPTYIPPTPVQGGVSLAMREAHAAAMAEYASAMDVTQRPAAVTLSSSVADVANALCGVIDYAVAAAQEIPQVERHIVTQYYWDRDTAGPFLVSVLPTDPVVVSCKQRIQYAINSVSDSVGSYVSLFAEYGDLLGMDVGTYTTDYAETLKQAGTVAVTDENADPDTPPDVLAPPPSSVDELSKDCRNFQRRARAVLQTVPPLVHVGPFLLDCEPLRAAVSGKAKALANALVNLGAKLAREHSTKLRDRYQRTVTRIQRKNTTAETLCATRDYVATMPQLTQELLGNLERLRALYAALDAQTYQLTDDDARLRWDVCGWPKRLDVIVENVRSSLGQEAERLQEVMAVEQEAFGKLVEKAQRQVAAIAKNSDLSKVAEYAADVKQLTKTLRELQQQAADFNRKEALFELPQTNYRSVGEVLKELAPYSLLWVTTNDWRTQHNGWFTDGFENLDAAEIENTVAHTAKAIVGLHRTFRDKPGIVKVIDEVSKSCAAFRPLVPLIVSLRSEGLKDRHWNAIGDLLGFPVRPKVTLNSLADVQQLLPHQEVIVKTCEVAQREWQIEESLSKMRTAWQSKCFSLAPSRGSPPSYVIQDMDDIVALLDEQLAYTQQLAFSPFRAHHAAEIEQWDRTLNTMGDVIEQLLDVQRQWLYLAPVFGSPDIAAQLPLVAKRFAKADAVWRKYISQIHANPNAFSFCTGPSKLVATLDDTNKTLDAVQKGLNEYLAEKRRLFPRFFFVSDEEMLAILAVSKDTMLLQQHIKKLFEGIAKLHFDDSISNIVKFQSPEGEELPLSGPIPCGNVPVEQLLGDIESGMHASVMHATHAALKAYKGSPRTSWVLSWPSQTVLTGSAAYFTAEVERFIDRAGVEGLEEYSGILSQQLQALVNLVQGPLTSVQSTTIGALLTVDVHARDIVDGLIDAQVDTVRDFRWTSNLRVYWEGQCVVRQVEATFAYGCEYLGAQSRLVIAQLTDRIFLTLTGALALNLGGAPAGPAGTGKTETCKDLAKVIAKQCVVFNCQDGMDHHSMAKFFKGLALAGAWACFDEFNRISPEVLSVVAQQVADLQQAASSGNLNITFEGTDIVVDPTYAIFITMNPGYAGRTELPDNLKVLFRPVACMVPDYAAIGEIRLFSYGYQSARTLSNKMVATFRLASEQLSSQSHYDFGMRAVNTVLQAAGLMKRSTKAEPGMSAEQLEVYEARLLLRALRDSNIPKFLEGDQVLFNAVVSDLFPGVDVPPRALQELEGALREATYTSSLIPTDQFVDKTMQFFELLRLRHGLMTVGPAGGGKTSLVQTLAKALKGLSTKPSAKHQLQQVRHGELPDIAQCGALVTILRCNPKSVTLPELYGSIDDATLQWSDGVLASVFRQAAQDEDPTHRAWVLFDGPVDAEWIESMNTVLDENKKLCLVSSEIITMSRFMTVLFEVGDLAEASPATVSRCGMVYIDTLSVAPLPVRVEAHIRALPRILRRFVPLIQSVLMDVTVPLVEAASAAGGYAFGRTIVDVAPTDLLANVLRIAEAMRHPLLPSTLSTDGPQEAVEGLARAIVPIYIFATVWGVGGALRDQRPAFDAAIKEKLVALTQGDALSSTRLLGTAAVEALLADEAAAAGAAGAGGAASGGARAAQGGGARGALTLAGGAAAGRRGAPAAAATQGGADLDAAAAVALVTDVSALIDSASVFDVVFDASAPGWAPWLSSDYSISHEDQYGDLLVPTDDAAQTAWLLKTLSAAGKHMLVVGPTGTGKTAVIQRTLLLDLPEKQLPITAAFTAHTSAKGLYETLSAKFEKRRKDVVGAPAGKQLVAFIDDLNLPTRERYGAQPPLELVRQLVDNGGWYQTTHPIRHVLVQDVSFVAACGPPGGNRHTICSRLQRQFVVLALPEPSDAQLKTIFSTMLELGYAARGSAGAPVPRAVVTSVGGIVNASVAVFRAVQQRFMPKPATPHYVFSTHDLSRLHANLYAIDPRAVSTKAIYHLLWAHEACRVFRDRLVGGDDRAAFDGIIASALGALGTSVPALQMHATQSTGDQTCFGPGATRLSLPPPTSPEAANVPPLAFGDFLVPSADPRSYVPVPSYTRLHDVVTDYLDELNENSTSRMSLSLFRQALDIVCSVSRALRLGGGHVLLLGPSGSGRRSLSRLAVQMCDYESHTFDTSKPFMRVDWNDYLKTLMMPAGTEQTPCASIISEDHLVHDIVLQNAASIMASGDVPGLFEVTEIDTIYSAMRPLCVELGLPTGKINLYSQFMQYVKKNVHFVICMSPQSAEFRTRLRNFPALVNNATVVTVEDWPAAALFSVAQDLFTKRGVTVGNSPAETNAVTKALCEMHQGASALYQRARDEHKQHVYVTPMSFLILLETFTSLLEERREFVTTQKGQLVNGLSKLAETEQVVQRLQVILKDAQPILQENQTNIERMLTEIQADSASADEARRVALAEESAMSAKQDDCRELAANAQAILDKALPALDAALKDLKNLKVKDIQEVAKYSNPSVNIKFVMEAVCIMRGVPPKMVGEAGRRVRDYWEPAKHMLSNAQELMTFFLTYDRDQISAALIAKIKPYVDDERFKPAKVREASVPCEAMCQWVHAMVAYYYVNETVQPLRRQLAQAEQSLEQSSGKLEESRAKLKVVEDNVAALEARHNEAVSKQNALRDELAVSELKLDRAGRLLDGLSSERDRWAMLLEKYARDEGAVLGAAALGAGFLAYLGPLSSNLRKEAQADWHRLLESLGLPLPPDPSLINLYGEPLQIQEWSFMGLPQDEMSIENGILLAKSVRWPLLVDPQGQARHWIGNMESEAGLLVTRQTDPEFAKTVEKAIRGGLPLMIENVGHTLDPSLDAILLRQTFTVGNTVMIKFRDNAIPYNVGFRLFIATKLPNPRFSPDVYLKLTVLNCFITPTSLGDQLLALVVSRERPLLEESKRTLAEQAAELDKRSKRIQDQILHLLMTSEGDILDDDDLVETLKRSRVSAVEIEAQRKEQTVTEEGITISREVYRALAVRAAAVFFAIVDLAEVDPMYHFSLSWFLQLFLSAVDGAEPSPDQAVRLQNLVSFFTLSAYRTVSRSLFERDKLLFAVTLAVTVKRLDGTLGAAEFRALLAGSAVIGQRTVEQLALAKTHTATLAWMGADAVGRLVDLEATLSSTRGLTAHMAANSEHYNDALSSSADAAALTLLEPFDRLNRLEVLCVLRAVRPDSLLSALRGFVGSVLGTEYITPPRYDIGQSFRSSDVNTPLLFVLSQGADPMESLLRFAEARKMSKKLQSISLGKGQGARATAMVKDAMERGGWVLLQNCHLAPSWMGELEALVDSFSSSTHATKREFRLWLSSMPTPAFPVSVLQVSVKMTNEPPDGLRANMLQAFAPITDEFLDNCERPAEFRGVLFSLAFFHSVLLERRRYGAVGWNVPYEFTVSDLSICVKQVHSFIDLYAADVAPTESAADIVPWDVLAYLSAQINFGGRVTDAWDRRLITTLIRSFMAPSVLIPGHNLAPDLAPSDPSARPIYTTVEPLARKDYVDSISQWPLSESPLTVGLHPNAALSFMSSEAMRLFATMLAMPRTMGDDEASCAHGPQNEAVSNTGAPSDATTATDAPGPASPTAGGGRDATVRATVAQLVSTLPADFDIEVITARFPILYEQSLNTVLVQEAHRYNRLLGRVRESLTVLAKAMAGDVLMTDTMEATVVEMYANKVPSHWAPAAYPSRKPLSSWFNDLVARCTFLDDWVQAGVAPTVFWLGGFHFPQAFLTAVLQNYARAAKIAVDAVAFDFEYTKTTDPSTFASSEPTRDYVYIHGLYLEGASFGPAAAGAENVDGGQLPVDVQILDESMPKVLYSKLPVVKFACSPTAVFYPAGSHPVEPTEEGYYTYACPVYRTLDRKGPTNHPTVSVLIIRALSTTGHSSNFVLTILLPTVHDPDHWVRRGTAAFLALDD